MNKQLLKDGLGWGFLLWLIGYVLGIVLFFVFPASLIGWIIMPVGVVITLLVLVKKIKSHSLQYFVFLAFIWTVIAMLLDYFLLVLLFKPSDGYYKLDVYLYYIFTFTLPLLVGWWKVKKAGKL